jgi:hypothetical protein
MNTLTPRTNDFAASRYDDRPPDWQNFARQLERELVTMTEAAVMERGYYQARAKELETLLVNTIQSKPSFPC